MRATPRVDHAIQQLKGVFLAQPDREVSVADACRLTGIEQILAGPILAALADVRFVRRRDNGAFVRTGASDGTLR
jgi:hypothetical protein